MRISALLKAKGSSVVTVAPSASIGEAVGLLAEHRVGALVVTEDGERIAGIVSERDVVLRLNQIKGAVVGEPVRSIMTSDVHTCSLEDEVESLMATMTEHRVRHIPVVSSGLLVGIVSIGDVVKSRIDELQRDRDQLVDYIRAR